MSRTNNDSFQSAWHNLKTYFKLYAENLKLLSLEKSTLLLSSVALACVLVLLLIVAFFFISVGVVLMFSQSIPLMWSFIIMGGVYVVAGIVIYAARVPLIVNPIARMLTRLFITDEEDDDEEKLTVSDYDDEEE